MYTTYSEAKRYAQAMLDILQEIEVEISLKECQHALALGGGYRDWRDLHQSLANGKVRSATPQGFEHRVLLAVPRMALDPTARWIEAQIERQRVRRQGGAYGNHEFSDRHVVSYEYVHEIPLVHCSVTPELLPGSKPGVRLRRNMVWDLSNALNEVHVDVPTMKLSFFGDLDTMFERSIDHPNFQREFEALVVFRLAKVTPFSGISASKNDPLSLRL